MTDQERIEQIKARCDAATNGPWGWGAVTEEDGRFVVYQDRGIQPHILTMEERGYEQPEIDADFIAHSREDVPFLLDLLSQAERATEILLNRDWNCDPSNSCYPECSAAWEEAWNDFVAEAIAARITCGKTWDKRHLADKSTRERRIIALESQLLAERQERERLEKALAQATTEVSIDDFDEGLFWVADTTRFSSKDERPELWEWLMRQPFWINTREVELKAKENK